MEELIGKRCSIIFDLPGTDWPLPGYPAWAVVEAIDMPMIKLDRIWVNTKFIQTITAYG
jgi:hypothetical protein